MYTHKEFYKNFQVNYFDYKQCSNEHLLSLDYEKLASIAGQLIDYDAKAFRLALKMDVRMTYLLSIDTLFELIYALLPDKKLQLMDKKIVEQLNRKNQYVFELIKYMDGKPSNFRKLLDTIIYTNDKSSSVMRYLFYLGIFETEHEDKIQESVIAYGEAIKFFGKEILESRDELNSFKHGLRLIPFIKELHIADQENRSNKLSIKVEESLSFQTSNKTIKTLHTKSLDYKRDLSLTYFVSNMIYNIITSRRYKYVDNSKGLVSMMAITKDALGHAKKNNVNTGLIKINFPIDNNFD